MAGASKKFLNEPFVKEYLSIARKNMALINGEHPKGDVDMTPRDGSQHLLHVKK